MGFVIWYKLSFRPGTGGRPLLQVSNDLLSADLLTRSVLTDAGIKTDAVVGARAATFKVTLVDLPEKEAKALVQEHRASPADKPMLVDIRLGYFDEPSTQKRELMTGAITSIRTEVTDDGRLLTTVSGQEETGYRLLNKPFTVDQRDSMPIADLLDAVEKATGVSVTTDIVDIEFTNHSVNTARAMEALAQVAALARLPLTIGGGKAVLGEDLSAEQVKFDANKNLVKQGEWLEHPDGDAKPAGMETATVLGDPALKIGTRVAPNRTVSAVTHNFSLDEGYTCEVTTVEGKLTAEAMLPPGAAAFAKQLSGQMRSTVDNRPLIQVGDITEYRPGHQATLTYSQDQPRDGTTASVDSPTAEDQLHDKPIAAPFAWDKCGLVVPVYPGMRSLLVHNRGELNDAVSAGFVWSRHAGHTPPVNEPGDYWLSLPTEVTDGRPTGKGVNDLTDAAGLRAIQAMGLSIEVGKESLTEIGARPTVPDPGTVVITNDKGARITIDGENISIGNGSASIEINGDEITINAKSIKLVASTVDVSDQ